MYAGYMHLGMPSRSDAEVVSMGFNGSVPVPGDLVKTVGNNRVEKISAATDYVYGVVAVGGRDRNLAIVTKGHVIASIDSSVDSNPTLGKVIAAGGAVSVNRITASNQLSQKVTAYEVKVG